MSTFQFLLLEEELLDPEAMQTILTDSSGIETLRAIEQSVPSLSISAIGLPKMYGYMLQQVQTLEQVRQIPAIALTAYAGKFNRQQAIQSGFQRHLGKPIEPLELIKPLIALINSEGTANRIKYTD